ncbi:melanophilin [Diretmus argenteus]
MMSGTAMGKKLDLSKLTDEEAKHVWEVVQRDFDLRKKEEDRLGDLKTMIEKEDTKRELLGNQTSLTESYCIRCLQPYKFLVNSKRQCLDCQLYTCKSCSRYNKKEHGWVCDPCHMARVLKIGTLEWYHENVRARFKRFGSAKVMRSLFKRHNRECSSSQNDLGSQGKQSSSDVLFPRCSHSSWEMLSHQRVLGPPQGLLSISYAWYTSKSVACPIKMKKTKRLLTVHPFDFDLDGDYSIDSRTQSYQDPSSHDMMERGVRELMTTEADMASVFHQSLEEHQGDDVQLHFNQRMSLDTPPRHNDIMYPDNRSTWPRSLSRLSHSSCGSGSTGGPRHSSSYLLGPEDSEEDECQRHPLYQSQQRSCSHTSQESLNSVAPQPQITELNRRMSAIENLLNRLEQVTSPLDQAPLAPQTPTSSSPLPQWEEVDLEEQQLRQKLDEMTGNISDHGLTSDEDESSMPHSPWENPGCRSPEGDGYSSRPTSRAGSLVSTPVENGQTESREVSCLTESLERKLHPLEEGSEASFRDSTALLVELEDKVAQTAASVQNAQSEVSYIENRIAALSAAGMSVDKGRKSAIPIPSRTVSHDFPTNQVDRFVRNSIYRGSLTQRTPVAKPQTKATCAV